MKKYIDSSIGRLRLVAFLEGSSLLLLLFVAMPLKYYFGYPLMTQMVGQLHGVFFLLFVALAVAVAWSHRWKWTTTLLVLLSSIVPFGTFYLDHKLLKKMHRPEA